MTNISGNCEKSKRTFLHMMKKYSLGIVFISMCLSAQSQAPVISNLPELNTFMQSDYHYKKNLKDMNKVIEGSPYLSDEFSTGSLIYQDTYYRNLQLRFNVYEGHFEFKSGDGFLYFDPRYTEVDTVWIGQDKYVYAPYIDNNREKRSYMHLLHDGNTKVLTLREKLLLRPEKAQGYEDAKPARFSEMTTRMFVSLEGEPAVEFSNRRSIDVVFPESAKELESYAKKERLRFRSPDELVTLVEYYETLQK